MSELKIEDLQLVESAAFKIQFDQKIKSPGKGKTKIDFGEIEIEAGGMLTNNNDLSMMFVNSTPVLVGLTEGEGGEEVENFRLEIEIRLAFSYKTSSKVTQEFIERSQWFFSAQIRTFFKIFADNALRYTTIKELKIPY